MVRFTDYTAEKVRSMCPSAAALRSKWSSAEERAAILAALEERGHFARRTDGCCQAAGRRSL